MGRNSVHVESNLDKIRNDLFGSIEQRISRATLHLHGKLIIKLSGSRSGRWYKLPHSRKGKMKGQKWQASASGQAPAVRYGDLRTSYEFKVTGSGADTVGVVGSPLEYAVWLEKGTRRMGKRPHLRKTYNEEKKEMTTFFRNLL